MSTSCKRTHKIHLNPYRLDKQCVIGCTVIPSKDDVGLDNGVALTTMIAFDKQYVKFNDVDGMGESHYRYWKDVFLLTSFDDAKYPALKAGDPCFALFQNVGGDFTTVFYKARIRQLPTTARQPHPAIVVDFIDGTGQFHNIAMPTQATIECKDAKDGVTTHITVPTVIHRMCAENTSAHTAAIAEYELSAAHRQHKQKHKQSPSSKTKTKSATQQTTHKTAPPKVAHTQSQQQQQAPPSHSLKRKHGVIDSTSSLHPHPHRNLPLAGIATQPPSLKKHRSNCRGAQELKPPPQSTTSTTTTMPSQTPQEIPLPRIPVPSSQSSQPQVPAQTQTQPHSQTVIPPSAKASPPAVSVSTHSAHSLTHVGSGGGEPQFDGANPIDIVLVLLHQYPQIDRWLQSMEYHDTATSSRTHAAQFLTSLMASQPKFRPLIGLIQNQLKQRRATGNDSTEEEKTVAETNATRSANSLSGSLNTADTALVSSAALHVQQPPPPTQSSDSAPVPLCEMHR